MAISKDKKSTLVADLTELLTNAKATAYAHYAGLSVAELQELRAAARAAGVKIKVVKNRLVKVAMQAVSTYKDTDTTELKDQLVYAISSEDEVTPAKVLAEFAKSHQALKLAGGFSSLGLALSSDEVNTLAKMPSKQELIAQVVATLLSPVNDVVSATAGSLSGVVSGLEQAKNA